MNGGPKTEYFFEEVRFLEYRYSVFGVPIFGFWSTDIRFLEYRPARKPLWLKGKKALERALRALRALRKKKGGENPPFFERQKTPPTGESVRLDCAYRRAAKGRRRKGFPSWAGNAPAHSITDSLTHRLFCAYGAAAKEKAGQGRVRAGKSLSALRRQI